MLEPSFKCLELVFFFFLVLGFTFVLSMMVCSVQVCGSSREQ